METDKSRGNEGHKGEFYKDFCYHLKLTLLLSFKMDFEKMELSTSQKQALTNLSKKRPRQKISKKVDTYIFT